MLLLKKYTILLFCFASTSLFAQQAVKKPTVSISGKAGVSYDYYGLTTNPSSPSFYTPRRPWNLVRFQFQPTISYGDFKISFNFNFSPMVTNFASPPFNLSRVPGFPKQSFGQWLTNPMNNIGINPSYKWAELQLGTQYLKYSDLSTGDVGAFGYGFSLKPGKLRVKFFRGVSQQAYQTFSSIAPVANFEGAYKRTITMGQIGLEKEDKYFAGFNIVKGIDDKTSITSPVTTPIATPKPAENFIVSFNTKFTADRGWYGQTELATTYSTRNQFAPSSTSIIKDNDPFIKARTSSYRDHAVQAGFGKKGKDWDIGASMKWLGAGYNTLGYPFVQNDRLEYTVNTRFNAFKKKTNVVASVGRRLGSFSTSSKTKQLIVNANVFTQFDDHFSLNINYNNFGFQTPGLMGIKNVGNDLGINPVYTWSNTKMSQLLSGTYNWSKYDEKYLGVTTTNNTHTALLLYVPTFFSMPNFSPDLSLMYFLNQSSLNKLTIYSAIVGAAFKMPKRKIDIRTQLQLNVTKIDPKTPSKNLLATVCLDWKLTKKLTCKNSFTGNIFKYGNELAIPLLGAQYFETMYRTALHYRFGK